MKLVNINGGHSIGVYNSEIKDQSEEEMEKEELIDKLSDSTSFANTHAVIRQLAEIGKWSVSQKNKLLRIALENTQVAYRKITLNY